MKKLEYKSSKVRTLGFILIAASLSLATLDVISPDARAQLTSPTNLSRTEKSTTESSNISQSAASKLAEAAKRNNISPTTNTQRLNTGTNSGSYKTDHKSPTSNTHNNHKSPTTNTHSDHKSPTSNTHTTHKSPTSNTHATKYETTNFAHKLGVAADQAAKSLAKEEVQTQP